MSNIEEMEKIYLSLKYDDIYSMESQYNILDFIKVNLEAIKDLHEENCKIWKVIAELQIGEMQKFHDKVFEKNLDNRKELNIDDKDNQKD